MVAFQEVMKYGRKSGVALGDYDTAYYAAAFGATGIRFTSMHEFENAFKHALTEPGITRSTTATPSTYTHNFTTEC
jgi:acetolactate synthase I/II/III large subunit